MTKSVCVVGGGTMGATVALTFSRAGFAVHLCGRNMDRSQAGKDQLSSMLERKVSRGKMEAAERDALLERITPSLLADCGDCVLAIEAINEVPEAKKKIYEELEEVLSEGAILASNTSSISITALANGLKHPSRFVGMHFFNPADVMALVEVISGAFTSEETMLATEKIAAELGKTSIRVKESPGFVVNRVLIPMINEAVELLDNGVASAVDIDTAMKLGANHPMGPLELGDLIGLDVCLAIMEVLQSETGDDKYRPHPLLRKMVRAGWLGRKAGRGFHEYKR